MWGKCDGREARSRSRAEGVMVEKRKGDEGKRGNAGEGERKRGENRLTFLDGVQTSEGRVGDTLRRRQRVGEAEEGNNERKTGMIWGRSWGYCSEGTIERSYNKTRMKGGRGVKRCMKG